MVERGPEQWQPTRMRADGPVQCKFLSCGFFDPDPPLSVAVVYWGLIQRDLAVELALASLREPDGVGCPQSAYASSRVCECASSRRCAVDPFSSIVARRLVRFKLAKNV